MSLENRDVIGWVDYPDGGPRATLFTDGTWSVPGREWIEDTLKLVYSDSYGGPSSGPFGPQQLEELAKNVKGTFHVEPLEESENSLLY